MARVFAALDNIGRFTRAEQEHPGCRPGSLRAMKYASHAGLFPHRRRGAAYRAGEESGRSQGGVSQKLVGIRSSLSYVWNDMGEWQS